MSPAFKVPGGVAIACRARGRRPRAAPCSVCGVAPHVRLCDGPGAAEWSTSTCDAKLCAGCAERVGPDRDLCPLCWLTSLGPVLVLVFWGMLVHELARRCPHGRWAPLFAGGGEWCIYCDSGQST